MADFLREKVKLPSGRVTTRVNLMRLDNGMVRCCICFEFFSCEMLSRDEGRLTDVCQPCADHEQADLAARTPPPSE